MSVGLLLITHTGIAKSLLDTADKMLGTYSTKIKALEVPLDASTESIKILAQNHIKDIDQGDGILILTDLYGSTPSNIGCSLLERPDIHLIAGVNLPMLVRVLNYSDLNLDELTVKAETGGKDGIIQCDCENKKQCQK
ncbi:MAG: PTS sugar transporter subunit IIA [Gammaproteobacteria bacterium]|nr:PTS sugar transporter subunit IIA [Gammaproteobacteria bacterium]MDH5736456.1 PTS sugar transporter subunit IIA [Gammaproteobacteria bacterium]